MPNQEVMKKWIEALESGEYQKTEGKLKTNKGYCCLGVLCDLYKKETGEGNWVDGYITNEIEFKLPSTIGYEIDLPPDVIEWAGLDSSCPRIPTPKRFENSCGLTGEKFGESVELAEINDATDATFNDIANLIKLNFLDND